MRNNKFKKIGLAFGLLGLVSITTPLPIYAIPNHINTRVISTNSENAIQILNSVNREYQKHNHIKLDFSLAFKGPNAATFSQSQKGQLWVKSKTNQYRIVLDDHEYISDGKTQWQIMKDIEEIQVTDISEGQTGQITPSNLFSFFQKGFKSKIIKSETTQGKNMWLIELTPEKNTLPYQKVQLRVVKNSYQIHEVLVFDKNKSQIKYQIGSLQKLNQVDPKTYQFDKSKYSKMEIVDLR